MSRVRRVQYSISQMVSDSMPLGQSFQLQITKLRTIEIKHFAKYFLSWHCLFVCFEMVLWLSEVSSLCQRLRFRHLLYLCRKSFEVYCNHITEWMNLFLYREGACLGFGLVVSSLCKEGLADSRDHVTNLYHKLVDRLNEQCKDPGQKLQVRLRRSEKSSLL